MNTQSTVTHTAADGYIVASATPPTIVCTARGADPD